MFQSLMLGWNVIHINGSIIHGIVEIMAVKLLKQNLELIKSAVYYAIILDETADCTEVEQVSISLRIALGDLTSKELFVDFYSTENDKSETLYCHR